MKRALGIIVLIAVVLSCKKDDGNDGPTNPTDGIKPEDKERAAALTTMLQSNKFRLSAYYSDSEIDYIDTDDVVKAEKDLWQYVSTWLHDDSYIFGSDGSLTIEQNEIKIPSDASATISKQYAVEADKEGVGFKFVGHEYQDLDYRLVEFSDTLLKVSATWNGKTVNSEYKVVE